MKYGFMHSHAEEFSIERMSKVLKVSRSGYYKFIVSKACSRLIENARLGEAIKVIHKNSRETYGSPRVHAQLKSQGESCSRQRVARLMQQQGIRAKMNKRFKITTKSNPKAQAAPNLLQQDFTALAPNLRCVADITFIATAQGWLYVAAILDLFSRQIVGLAMNKKMTTDLISSALAQAVKHRKPKTGLIHHSDKGCQYTSLAFKHLLKKHQMLPSNSGTGNCFDNSAMESFFHTLKRVCKINCVNDRSID
jgi:putative transposase